MAVYPDFLTSDWFLILIIILVVWSIFWKGITLWKSAKNNQKIWFIILLIVNTFGILEIIYLKRFQKKK